MNAQIVIQEAGWNHLHEDAYLGRWSEDLDWSSSLKKSAPIDAVADSRRASTVCSLTKILGFFLLLMGWLSVASAQNDIFAVPSAKKPAADSYPTSAAFIAATRSGEIPEMLLADYSPPKLQPVVYKILVNEYGLNPSHLYAPQK